MAFRLTATRHKLVALCGLAFACPLAHGQQTTPTAVLQPPVAATPAPAAQPAPGLNQPVYRVAATPNPQSGTIQEPAQPALDAAAQPGEHPLAPALRWARAGLPQIQSLGDYSCTMYKRERIDGQLGEMQAMYAKVRHQPFSVYLYFLSPANMKGQEVIYVEGQNDGNLQAHATGLKNIVGTVSLSPTGHMAMRGNRYPLTEIGVANLVQRLIEVGERDSRYGECDVTFQKAKVSGRQCTLIQVTHPVPRRNFLFHLARIFVDDELNIPIRYESYDWPARAGGEPQLMEEYTYLNVKLNNGFSDLDFNTENPKYGFR